MNREIKFRARDELYKKMVYSDKVGGLMGFFHAVEQRSNKPPAMQLTGICDKDGKEKYEKDVIEFRMVDADKEPLRLPVAWEEKGAGFHRTDGTHTRGVDMISRYNTISGEVIGNIYENPELLNRETAHG